ncbi:MAG: class IV adenylate cyclase [Rickettsiales bacterium]|jgi:adenylate cyclase class 2|nr:class IV adenylate cyclase [Rickettsiales bacterium]
MKTEFECRFVDIDVDDIRARLAAAGFACVHPEHLLRRKIFMLPDLDGAQRWLRLRDEGDKTTLTLKLKSDISNGASAMKEIECIVDDFSTMGELLESSGLECSAYEENRREKWTRGNVEACIDTWPGLDAFLEVEASDEDALRSAVAELGLDYRDAMFGNVTEVYGKKLGLTLDEIHASCTFANPPKKR